MWCLPLSTFAYLNKWYILYGENGHDTKAESAQGISELISGCLGLPTSAWEILN